MKWISAALLLFLAFNLQAAQSVTLAWDANSETNVAGYRLYVGRSSRTYDTNWTITVMGRTNTTATFTNMIIGKNYYFAATAFTDDALESDYSEEVVFGFKPGKPVRLRAETGTNQTVSLWIENWPLDQATVERSRDLLTWTPWAAIRSLEPQEMKGLFLSGTAPGGSSFWRVVVPAPAPAYPPLPEGLILAPIPSNP